MSQPIKTLTRRALIGGAGVALTMPALVRGAAAAQDAMAVAQAMNTAELTRSFVASATVSLHRGGAPVRRALDIAVMRQGNSDKSLRRYGFTAPADIAGTRLLVRENSGADSDTWLFLPAVGRTRRISTSNQSGAFAGTDFSYADMMSMRLEKYQHSIAASDGRSITLDSVVTSGGYAKSIGYSRVVTYIQAGSMIPFRVDYYDLKGRQFKTQEMSGARVTPDGRHILTRRVMTVPGRGLQTQISISGIQFATALRAADFDPKRLSS